MRFHTAVLAFFIVAGLTRAFAADSPDADFVREAAKGGRHEVDIGKLADQKATHQDTKMFAKHLIDDHSKMNEELTTLAQKLGIALPDAQKDEKEMMDMLNSKSGMAFDRAFANMALEHHKADVAAFDNEAKNGKDEQVKAFAAKNLDGLRMHLKMAQDLNDKLSKGAALNDPEAEAALNVSVSNDSKAETVPIDYSDNPAVTQPAETAETVPYGPAPEVRDVEREPINTADKIVNEPVKTADNVARDAGNTVSEVVRAPIQTAGDAVSHPVDTATNVAGNTVNKAADIATHPVRTAKDAVTHPIQTAKDIVTAPFKGNREERVVEYSDSEEFKEETPTVRTVPAEFSETVRYEPYVESGIECSTCETKVKHSCSSCNSCCESSQDIVYDNDYRATTTELIEHHDDDECH